MMLDHPRWDRKVNNNVEVYMLFAALLVVILSVILAFIGFRYFKIHNNPEEITREIADEGRENMRSFYVMSARR